MADSNIVIKPETINTECPICICPMDGNMDGIEHCSVDVDGNIGLLVLSCKHGLHKSCAIPFLKTTFKNRENVTCPFCRSVEFESTTNDYWDTFEIMFPEEHKHCLDQVQKQIRAVIRERNVYLCIFASALTLTILSILSLAIFLLIVMIS